MRKKGQFFELDLIIAMVVLVAGILLLKAFFIQDTIVPQVDRTTQDVVTTLETLSMKDLDDTRFNYYVSESLSDVDGNSSIARQILIFRIEGQNDLADELASEVLEDVLPAGLGINISLVSSDQRLDIYESSYEPVTDEISQSKTLLSGLEIGEPIEGFSGSMSLTQATNNLATYTYFGGFAGQGNLTTSIDLPSMGDEYLLEIEGEFNDDFDVVINGVNCFTVSVNSDVTYEDITDPCIYELYDGKNLVEIIFLGDDLEDMYVGGGYIKLSYANHNIPLGVNNKEIHLTGIDGVANLYDAIDIPGDLQSIEVQIDYYIDRTNNDEMVFFKIGNYTLFEDNLSSGMVSEYFSNTDMNSIINDYSNLEGTVPIRFGYLNLTNVVQTSSNAHTALITDVSGSMGPSSGTFGLYPFPSENCTYNYTFCDPDCNNYTANCHETIPSSCVEPFNRCNVVGQDFRNHTLIPSTHLEPVTRLEMAQIVGKDFATYIINASDENAVGLTSYASYTNGVLPLTNDSALLNSTIDAYTAGGATCVACGIVNATALVNKSPPGYSRSMLVMSDGDANRCFDDGIFCGNGVSCSCGVATASQQALYYAELANASNITLYSVAFAQTQGAGYDLMYEIAEINNGSADGFFFEGNNPETIAAAYGQIAQQIIQSAKYENQIVVSEQELPSELFNTSYIEITYEPWDVQVTPGSILVNGEYSPFSGSSCNANVVFPQALTPLTGKLTSYSGDLWTAGLDVNGVSVYDLDFWNDEYVTLGDPFSIVIPKLDNSNSLSLYLRDITGAASTDCSIENKLHFTAKINSTVILSDVYPNAEGCTWEVDFFNSLADTKVIPTTYTGTNTCTYTMLDNDYDDSDAFQVLGQKLFETFDIDGDGEVDVNFDDINLEIEIDSLTEIPYLWGPAILEVVVWR